MQAKEAIYRNGTPPLPRLSSCHFDLLDLEGPPCETPETPTACLIPDLNSSTASPSKNLSNSLGHGLDRNEHSNSCKELRRLSAVMSSSLKLISDNCCNNNYLSRADSLTLYEPPPLLSEKLKLAIDQVTRILHLYSQSSVINQPQNLNSSPNPYQNLPPLSIFSEVFMKENLHVPHTLQGEKEISDVISFIVGRSSKIVTPKQSKRMHQLRSAVFKECGFTVSATVIPVICFKRPSPFKLFSGASSSLSSTGRKNSRDAANLQHVQPDQNKNQSQSANNNQYQNFHLIFLLQVKNRQKNMVIIDAYSRMYKNIKDWQRNNTLPPSTLIVHMASSDSHTSTLHQYKSPSSKTSKYVIDSTDIIIGVGAVTTGIVAILSGGTILPFLIAGEIFASVYLTVRGCRSLHDTRKHRAKLRQEVS